MNNLKRRKFNNLYWTYLVIAICTFLMTDIDYTRILAFLVGITTFGISCEQIAKLTGIPYSTVGRIRYNSIKSIKLEHVVKIAKVLDIDLNELKGE